MPKPNLTEPGEVTIKRALLSVSDKRGIVEFARGLSEMDIELVSTGGTAAVLQEAGLAVRAIDDYTGFPEIMDGRVKTLHPRIYAGLLCVRSNLEHVKAIDEIDCDPIDLVCVNLYPFERTAAQRGSTDEEVIENIDIGGPTLIRASAKNSDFTAVVVSPESYDAVLEELTETNGKLSLETRESLASDAFGYTARYDASISRWFDERTGETPDQFLRAYEKSIELPYGENPHQRAAYYVDVDGRTDLLSMVGQHQGKELSYNNLLDLDSGRRIMQEFELPTCVILKHNNPCGAAVGATLMDAYHRALACDPLSAFGGVFCFNRKVDKPLAEKLVENFIELVFAPGYDGDALDVLSSKDNLRVLDNQERRDWPVHEPEVRGVRGGILVQDRDVDIEDRDIMNVITHAQPSEQQWGELLFAWRICKHVKSNSIVIARELGTLGIGAGQMSRVDSVKVAVEKAHKSLEGAVLASDGFFPFADGPNFAIKAGITAIVQPGGSKRDAEVVAACDEAGVAMVFTNRRHFKH